MPKKVNDTAIEKLKTPRFENGRRIRIAELAGQDASTLDEPAI